MAKTTKRLSDRQLDEGAAPVRVAVRSLARRAMVRAIQSPHHHREAILAPVVAALAEAAGVGDGAWREVRSLLLWRHPSRWGVMWDQVLQRLAAVASAQPWQTVRALARRLEGLIGK